MTIENHSVVYFVNEEYGVVIRAKGATGDVAMWDRKRGCFGRRIDLPTASFLARTDRFRGEWCAAHPTRSRATAEKAAAWLVPNLPGSDGMRLAQAAKLAAMRARLREKGTAALAREIAEQWHVREAQYAGM